MTVPDPAGFEVGRAVEPVCGFDMSAVGAVLAGALAWVGSGELARDGSGFCTGVVAAGWAAFCSMATVGREACVPLVTNTVAPTSKSAAARITSPTLSRRKRGSAREASPERAGAASIVAS